MKRYAASYLPMLLIVTACTSGPPLRTFLLTPAMDQAALAPMPASAAGLVVLRRVIIPDYLDTTDILLRVGTNEVKASDTGRWGERLSLGLTRALAVDLAVRLPSDRFVLDASNKSGRQLLINVNGLDIRPDGRCTIAATWTIVDHGLPLAVVHGGGTFDSSSADRSEGVGDARLVDALSRTAGKLADAIILDIRPITEPSTLHAD